MTLSTFYQRCCRRKFCVKLTKFAIATFFLLHVVYTINWMVEKTKSSETDLHILEDIKDLSFKRDINLDRKGTSIWDVNKLYSQADDNVKDATGAFERGRELLQEAFSTGSIGDHKFIVSQSSDELRLSYPSYHISEPRFISEEDRIFFWHDRYNQEWKDGIVLNENLRTGHVKFIKGGQFASTLDCGWKTKLEKFQQDSYVPSHLDEHLYVPLLVPDSFAFQHFIDGALPKIVQGLPFLLQNNVSLVIYDFKTNPVIPAILDRLGLKHTSIKLFSRSGKQRNRMLKVDYELNTCITPPLHPLLSQTTHTLIGAPWDLPFPFKKGLVILLNREMSSNLGRKILNRRKVELFLRQRYRERFHAFTGVYNLNRAIDVFGKASIIIGVHGGAFYNLNFSPRQTVVVEVMPTWRGQYPQHLAYTMIWRMADALGQQYWRINEQASDFSSNLVLSITKLQKVLDVIDKENH